ncbi:hypothetical protein RclHR1_08580007 [Rhizophagus clarus]|uniref:Uncharacterized protein n=1 Tax=Rhizophagus clarus TaxID=94130 RepID=A0A2Z6S108_9GLOM|nr:hypothetical protein RclHR1_08580007 [Rhizophagus clarus]GET03340.1 hypothetical protein RCL_jg16200.t1 [Rhizophagus clarus]
MAEKKRQELPTSGAIRAHDGHFLTVINDTENPLLEFHWNKDDPLNEKRKETIFQIDQNGDLYYGEKRVMWKSNNEENKYWIKLEQLENEYVLRIINTENNKAEKYITINIEDLELKDEPEVSSVFTIITTDKK